MAKKTTKRTNRSNLSYIFSWICLGALILFGLISIFQALPLDLGSGVVNVLSKINSIATLLLMVCVIYFAYGPANSTGKFWVKVLFWVSAVLALVGGGLSIF